MSPGSVLTGRDGEGQAPCSEDIKEPGKLLVALAGPRGQNPREQAGFSTWCTGRMGKSITDLKLGLVKKGILERAT